MADAGSVFLGIEVVAVQFLNSIGCPIVVVWVLVWLRALQGDCQLPGHSHLWRCRRIGRSVLRLSGGAGADIASVVYRKAHGHCGEEASAGKCVIWCTNGSCTFDWSNFDKLIVESGIARRARPRSALALRRSYIETPVAHRDCFNCGSPIRFRPIGYYDCLEGLGGAIESSPLIEYAEALCRESFRFPGYADARLGVSPQWNRWTSSAGNNGPRWSPGGIVLVSPDGSDVKVPVGALRLQFLPLRGQTFRLTGDVRFRRRALHLLADWISRGAAGAGHQLDGCHGSGVAPGQHLPDARAAVAVSARRSGPAAAHRALLVRSPAIHPGAQRISHLCRSNHYLSNVSACTVCTVFSKAATWSTGASATARRWRARSSRRSTSTAATPRRPPDTMCWPPSYLPCPFWWRGPAATIQPGVCRRWQPCSAGLPLWRMIEGGSLASAIATMAVSNCCPKICNR